MYVVSAVYAGWLTGIVFVSPFALIVILPLRALLVMFGLTHNERFVEPLPLFCVAYTS